MFPPPDVHRCGVGFAVVDVQRNVGRITEEFLGSDTVENLPVVRGRSGVHRRVVTLLLFGAVLFTLNTLLPLDSAFRVFRASFRHGDLRNYRTVRRSGPGLFLSSSTTAGSDGAGAIKGGATVSNTCVTA